MNKKIVIIDYDTGNIASISNAINRIGAKYIVSNSKNEIKNSTHLILPGVGSFKQAINNLKKTKLISTIENEVFIIKKPILGICVGMQLMFEKSYEDGEHDGLAWFKGTVNKIITSNQFKTPHVGWNNVKDCKDILLKDCKDLNFYFDHNYECIPKDKKTIKSYTEYGKLICSSVSLKNIYAVQFHPEKSQLDGLRLLKTFIEHD